MDSNDEFHNTDCDCYNCWEDSEAALDREFDEKCALGYL